MKSIFDGYNRIHFDVGANEGIAALHYARHEPKTFVVAFEPIPKLVSHMAELSTHLKNILIVKNAVSDYNGNAKFNVSPESQYGDFSCSSLLDFSDKSKTEWPGREDFKVINEIDVDVIRLDRFIVEYNVPKIDYLKIDTQGNDIKVLEGCGEFLSIVNEGEMEAGAKSDILYKGQNTEKESIKFLESHNFEIIAVQPNDVFTNEVNIFFRNKSPKITQFNKIWLFQ
jgi:FkbM family methyltransferase